MTTQDPFGFTLTGDEARELSQWYEDLDAAFEADPVAVAERDAEMDRREAEWIKVNGELPY